MGRGSLSCCSDGYRLFLMLMVVILPAAILSRPSSAAFQSSNHINNFRRSSASCSTTTPTQQYRRHCRTFSSNKNENDDTSSNQNNTSTTTPTTASKNPILDRFLSPQIDDKALPLSDVSVAQIIAPTLQVVWLGTQGAPSPSWLQPIFPSSSLLSSAARGSLLAPLLIHGAALASCWLLGALAAKAYENKAILAVAPPDESAKSSSSSRIPNSRTRGTESDEYGYRIILARVCQAGAFATGLLILGTQLDLFVEYGGRWVQFGDSPEIDFRLNLAAVEVVNDVVFEAMTLITWRLAVAFQNSYNFR